MRKAIAFVLRYLIIANDKLGEWLETAYVKLDRETYSACMNSDELVNEDKLDW